MARFHIEPSKTGVAGFEMQCDNWMVAVSLAMEKAGVAGDAMSRMVCDIDADGVITVQVPGTGQAFVVRQLDAQREEISSSIDAVRASLPADVLDPPEPAQSAAFAGRDLDEADLDLIIERSRRIAQARDFDAACAVALDILLSVVPAESASVLVHVPETESLRFAAARGPRSEVLAGVQMPDDQGIAGLVLRSGTSLLVREASAAPHHYQVMDMATGYRTRGLLAVPLRTTRGVAGVLELLNPFGSIDFEERHQDAATIVAGRLATRLDTAT